MATNSSAVVECDCDQPNSDGNECMYGECHLKPLSELYDAIHLPLCFCICAFGTVSNILNIIVLTRKRMRTPINVLLTGLSIAQWLLAFNYLGLLSVDYFRDKCLPFYWAHSVAMYRLINVNLNIVFHTVAFALTIAVAVFRWAAMKWPIQANRHLYHTRPAFRLIIIMWFIVPLLVVPSFFAVKLRPVTDSGCSFDEMYDLRYEGTAFISVFGIGLKLIPSLLLTVLIVALVRTLKSVERRRIIWHNQSDDANGLTNTNTSKSISERNIHRRATRRRTTRMLVAILILCDAVELPHGVLHLCTGIYGITFGTRIYDQLGSLMEMLTLFYSSVSFILYCTMSADFLRTFEMLFCPPFCVARIARIESHGGGTGSTGGLYGAVCRKLTGQSNNNNNNNQDTCISLSNCAISPHSRNDFASIAL